MEIFWCNIIMPKILKLWAILRALRIILFWYLTSKENFYCENFTEKLWYFPPLMELWIQNCSLQFPPNLNGNSIFYLILISLQIGWKSLSKFLLNVSSSLRARFHHSGCALKKIKIKVWIVLVTSSKFFHFQCLLEDSWLSSDPYNKNIMDL